MSDSKTKDAKSAPAQTDWDGEADPVTPHGGDWFWGGNPPVPEGLAVKKSAAKEPAKP